MKYGGMHIFCQILWNFPEISETDKISYYLYLFISLFHSPPQVDAPAEHASGRAVATWFGQASPTIQAAAVGEAGTGAGDVEDSVPEAIASNQSQVSQAMKVFMTKALASGHPNKYNGQISHLMSEDTDNEAVLARQLIDLSTKANTLEGAERAAAAADFLETQQKDTQRLIESIQDQTETLNVDDGQARSLAALTGALNPPPPPSGNGWLLFTATIAAAAGAFAAYQRRKPAGSSPPAGGSETTTGIVDSE